MPSLSASEAKACIDRAIFHQLLLAMAPLLQSGSSQKEPQMHGVSRQVRKALLADPRAVESLQILLAKINRKRAQWLTAEQAASMMGFSLPYASALFDSDEFGGKVKKKRWRPSSHSGLRCSRLDARQRAFPFDATRNAGA